MKYFWPLVFVLYSAYSASQLPNEQFLQMSLSFYNGAHIPSSHNYIKFEKEQVSELIKTKKFRMKYNQSLGHRCRGLRDKIFKFGFKPTKIQLHGNYILQVMNKEKQYLFLKADNGFYYLDHDCGLVPLIKVQK